MTTCLWLSFFLLKENSRLLQERGVAYINADSSIEGEYHRSHRKRCENGSSSS